MAADRQQPSKEAGAGEGAASRRTDGLESRAQRLARVGSWTWEPAPGTSRWTPEMLRVFGLDPDLRSPPEGGIAAVVHPDDRPAFDAAWTRAESEGAPFDIEVRSAGPSGGAAWVRLVCESETGADGSVTRLYGVAQDVTERRSAEAALGQSNAKLRSLAVHLLSAREEERKKVAQEIHDELGQVLTALVMDMRWLDKRLAGAARPVRAKLRATVDLADQAIRTVQRISAELRPRMLDDLGLAAALEWLGGDFSRRMGMTCAVEVAVTEGRIGGNAATTVFRIVQEALTNVARHARARSVSVRLREEANRLLIEVSDDGVGITEEQAGGPTSFGLIGLRERVQGLQGELSVLGRQGQGTVVRAVIPYPGTGALA
jgi:signal transduction histidine kinase